MDALDDSSLHLILQQLELQDLLHASRCCRRLHAACQQDALWRTLFLVTFGAASSPPSSSSRLQHQKQQQQQQQQQHSTALLTPPPQATTWRQAFTERSAAAARIARLSRKVKRIRLSSDVATLQRELVQMRQQLKAEAQTRARLTAELAQVRRRLSAARAGAGAAAAAGAAGAAPAAATRGGHRRGADGGGPGPNGGVAWQLEAVRRHHEALVQATPVSLEAQRERLAMELRVCDVEQQTLRKAVRGRESRLAVARSRLSALDT